MCLNLRLAKPGALKHTENDYKNVCKDLQFWRSARSAIEFFHICDFFDSDVVCYLFVFTIQGGVSSGVQR